MSTITQLVPVPHEIEVRLDVVLTKYGLPQVPLASTILSPAWSVAKQFVVLGHVIELNPAGTVAVVFKVQVEPL